MEVRYKEDGSFRIIQYTDVHLGTYPFSQVDQKTLAGIKDSVINQNPDLIVFTGDIIYSLEDHGATNPQDSFKHFLNFLDDLEVPTAITLGNHDAEDKVTRTELVAMVEKNLTYQAKESNIFTVDERKNYTVQVLSSDGTQVKNLVYIMDSGDYSGTDHSYYAWILQDQIDWFKEVSQNYKREDGNKTDLIFLHIPLMEYWLAALDIQAGNFNEDMEMNLSWLGQDQVKDFPFKNGVCSPELNSGFFMEIAKSDQVWGVFAGHDHDNNFDGLHKGVHLVYGQSTGYNSYGSEPKGARIIDLDEKTQEIKTYTIEF